VHERGNPVVVKEGKEGEVKKTKEDRNRRKEWMNNGRCR
jgi:hypothetical protein